MFQIPTVAHPPLEGAQSEPPPFFGSLHRYRTPL